MITKYKKNNNLCYGGSTGSILITEIKLTTVIETINFASYEIEWSNNIDQSQISSGGLRVFNLSNGIYTYRLKSLINNQYSTLTTIEITSPSEISLNELNKSEYSCGNNGYYKASITGGTPPYICRIGSQTAIVSPEEPNSETILEIDNLFSGEQQLSINDSNNCIINAQPFLIKDDSITLTYNNIYPPTLYDSYGSISLDIIGFGPFDLEFYNTTTGETISYSQFNNPYLTEIIDQNNITTSVTNGFTALGDDISSNITYSNTIPASSIDKKQYKYLFDNCFSPGIYNLTINPGAINNRCSLTSNFTIPNISPITVLPRIIEDNPIENDNLILSRDIYDTILVPFKHISNNSELWQLIESLTINKSIYLNINNVRHEFIVVRNMLDKYYTSNDRNIEILKLSNSSDGWFYYFYVSPGIEISSNNDSQNIELYDPKNKISFPLTLGLTQSNEIDNTNASLIRGSFIISGTGYNELHDGVTIKVATGDQPNDNDLSFTDVSRSIVKNIYSPLAYDTTINFLEKYNVLTYNVNLENIIINSVVDDSIIQKNVTSLLKIINNIANYNNIYIYAETEPQHNGLLDLDIVGQTTFVTKDGIINNSFSIKYFTFTNTDNELKSIYINNSIVENIEFLNGLDERYVLIRIEDIYGNIPKYINFNNTLIPYDDHYVEILQILNSSNIIEQIKYGDILVYIGNLSNTSNIPYHITSEPVEINNVSSEWIKSTIGKSSYSTNTNNEISTIESSGLSISIKISPQNTKCIIYGPKNYYNIFDKDATFSNLLPGVYIIKGDSDYLNNNLLYQNETRVILDNTNELVNLIFNEYKNKTTFI